MSKIILEKVFQDGLVLRLKFQDESLKYSIHLQAYNGLEIQLLGLYTSPCKVIKRFNSIKL